MAFAHFRITGRLIFALMAWSLPGLALDRVAISLGSGGNDGLRDTLTEVSLLSTFQDNPSAPAGDVLSAAKSDYTRFVEALYEQGYFSPTVAITLDGREAAQISPFDLPNRFKTANIRVDPGPKFTFGQVRIAPLPKETTLLDAGATARVSTLRDATKRALDQWYDAGHAQARIADQIVTARHAQAKLDVEIIIDPGPRLRFGEVTVSGQSRVKDARVRQMSGLPRGALTHPDAVEKAAERLRKTGTFSSVTITPLDQANPDGSLDYNIAVVDRKPRRFGAGVEVSTLEGLTLSGFWLHRNLFGGAERLRISAEAAQLGSKDQGADGSVQVRFEKPAVYGPDTLFFAQLDLSRDDAPDFLKDTAQLTFGASRRFTDALTGQLGVSVATSKITDRFAVPETSRSMLLYSLPFSVEWDQRDDALNPTKGLYLSAEVIPFREARQKENGARLFFDVRGYHAPSKQRDLVFAGRLQLGSVTGPDAVDAPPDYLFYSGGGGTVRGQPFDSLDADYGGTRLGGQSFVGLSGEVRFPVGENLGLVAFADAGFIGSESFGGDGAWHSGAGLGVRYKTPIGPIRLDVAAPVSGTTGGGPQVYIGIGQAF